MIAIRIDVVVVVIDRVHEMLSFMHFVGMPIAPCFNLRDHATRAHTWACEGPLVKAVPLKLMSNETHHKMAHDTSRPQKKTREADQLFPLFGTRIPKL